MRSGKEPSQTLVRSCLIMCRSVERNSENSELIQFGLLKATPATKERTDPVGPREKSGSEFDGYFINPSKRCWWLGPGW